jgi:hypothetical protein
MHEVILEEIKESIVITEQDLETKMPAEPRKNSKKIDMILQDCDSMHQEIWDFNEIDKNAWYKEGTALFGTKCKGCLTNISEVNITVSKPVQLCKNYGAKGCCVTFCNKCWMEILNNTNNTNKRRGR